MWLKKLNVLNFKNYTEANLEFDARVNVFAGLNGSGKTNLLDSIHYLALCKSYFNPIDSQNIRVSQDWFMVQGEFEIHQKNENISCSIKRNQKKLFKRNKKEYPRLADHIGLIPLVMISPADSLLILEGSEERRKFIDNVLSQTDSHYLDQILAYNKALLQRNTLLKQATTSGFLDKSLIEIFDDQLVEYGQIIYEKRQRFLNEFMPHFKRFYTFICEFKEEVELIYESQLHKNTLKELLKQNFEKDSILERTNVGIHKDDLLFQIHESLPLKKFGSQGQQKSFLVALKLAQYSYLRENKNLNPILLLDDIFDKFDDSRMKRLMELVSTEEFGQIFITDTDASRIHKIFEDIQQKVKIFHIHSGEVKLMN